MGADKVDKKKVAILMSEVFSDNDVAKVELSMEEAGKLTQAVLCKAIDPDVSDNGAMEVMKRGRALVTAIAEQEGQVKKAEGSDDEITVYSIEKALVDAVLEDVKGVEVSGSWGANMDALRKRFETTDDGEGDLDDNADDNREPTNKNVGDEDDESVWGRAYDLNKKQTNDEDWGKDPGNVRG